MITVRPQATFTDDDVQTIMRALRTDGYAYVAPVSADFDHERAAGSLGSPVEQYHGRFVRDVKPDPQLATAEISASNMKALAPHTENFEFAGLPPRIVYLWAVEAAEGAGGETTLCDGWAMLASLPAEDRKRLEESSWEWRSPASLASEGIELAVTHRMVEQSDHGPVLRYSTREMRPVDAEHTALRDRVISHGSVYFEQTEIATKINTGGALVWDNWRMIHSRRGFTDPRRHLRRILIAPRSLA